MMGRNGMGAPRENHGGIRLGMSGGEIGHVPRGRGVGDWLPYLGPPAVHPPTRPGKQGPVGAVSLKNSFRQWTRENV